VRKIEKIQIKLIKIAQKQIGLSDDEYRTILSDRYWVNSCTQLSYKDASDLIDHFKELGFRMKVKRGKQSMQRPRDVKRYKSSRAGLIEEIEDIARERFGEGWEVPLNALCRKFGVEKYRWLDISHGKVIKARLKEMQEQKRKVPGGA